VYSLYSTSQTRTGLDQVALRVTALGGSMVNGLMGCSSSTSLSRSSRRCRSVRPVPTFPIWTSDPESSWAPRINDSTPPAAPPAPGRNLQSTASQLARMFEAEVGKRFAALEVRQLGRRCAVDVEDVEHIVRGQNLVAKLRWATGRASGAAKGRRTAHRRAREPRFRRRERYRGDQAQRSVRRESRGTRR